MGPGVEGWGVGHSSGVTHRGLSHSLASPLGYGRRGGPWPSGETPEYQVGGWALGSITRIKGHVQLQWLEQQCRHC